MSGMTESAQVKKINELLGERYRNRTTNRSYLMIKEVDRVCTLEAVDRRTVEVSRETLDDPYSAWERQL